MPIANMSVPRCAAGFRWGRHGAHHPRKLAAALLAIVAIAVLANA